MNKKNNKKAAPAIDLTPTDKDSLKTESIVEEAERISIRRRDKSSRKFGETRGRKSKAETDEENKLQDMEKAAAILVQSTFASLVAAITTLIAYMTDDRKWQADQTECKALTSTILGYVDLKFPEWRTQSPEVFLLVGLSGYLLPRIAIIEKESIEKNPYKGWFKKLIGKLNFRKAKNAGDAGDAPTQPMSSASRED